MRNLHNVLSVLNMMRGQGFASYKNQHGQVVFAGMSRLTENQRQQLLQISQEDFLADMKWQQA